MGFLPGTYLTATLLGASACVPHQALRAPAPHGTLCTEYDYGSGMVAMLLPQAALEQVTAIHDRLVADGNLLTHNPLARLPYQPHISVVYGINPANEPAAAEALQAWANDAPPLRLSFGQLVYWDDPASDKTTFAVQICGPGADQLFTLHETLVKATGVAPRQPYLPHMTLAFFTPYARLSKASEREVLDSLANLTLQVASFIVTDRCGSTALHVRTKG